MPDDLKVFAAPVLRGGRFDDHTIPVDVLPQFIAYRDLVLELGKELYRKRYGRRNVPPHFEAGFNLKLQKVEGDCAVPVLARPEVGNTVQEWLPGPESGVVGDFYDEARDLIAATIDAVARNRPLPDAFPPEFLEDLYKLGNYLKDDEALELRGPTKGAGPVYNAMVRLQLGARVTKQSYSRVATLVGTVVSFDWETGHFRLRTLDGYNVVGSHNSTNAHVVLKALQEKKFRRVDVTGTVQFRQEDNAPLRISDILTVKLWSGTDEADVRHVDDRLRELAGLREGWLDGEGSPVPQEGGQWLATRLIALMADHSIPRPKLYPTPEGHVQAVWRTPPWRIEAEFDVVERSVSLLAINTATEEDKEAELDLTKAEHNRKLLAFLQEFFPVVPKEAP